MRTLTVLFISTLLAGVGLVSPAPAFSTGPTVISSGKVYCDGENQPAAVKYAQLAFGPGDSTVVAAVTGKKIRVLSYAVNAALAGAWRFESGVGTAQMSGYITTPANTTTSLNCGATGCFETAAGALLNFEATTATFYGHITYIECS